METPLAEVPATPAQPVAPEIATATDAQLEAMIVQKQQEILSEAAQTPATTVPAVVTTPEQTQGQATPAQPQAQNEPSPAPAMTFEELQKKTGVPNADVLANNYRELQRELTRKSQELAQLKRNETAPVPTIPNTPPPVSNVEQMNQAFVNDLSKDPLGTIAAVVRSITEQQTKPLYEQQKDTKLRSELVRLSSSPDTATFNLPEVQKEIKQVFEENPSYQLDMGSNLENAYTLAMGRLARKGAVGLGTQPQRPAAVPPAAGFMEGRNVPTQPQPFNPQTVPLVELEKQIKALQSQL